MADEAELRTAVVVDYQNIHLTGHDLFAVSKHRPPHESLVDPLNFANQLVTARNNIRREGMAAARLSRVAVYRGQPSPEHDAKQHGRNQAQRARWERDPRVNVHYRPLKYSFRRDQAGQLILDHEGKRIVEGKREKGIDVLCALAVVRESQDPDVDLVILASHDTDLEPALDEVLLLGRARVETCQWFDSTQPYRTRQLQPTSKRKVWNTRLGEAAFRNSWDLNDYT